MSPQNPKDNELSLKPRASSGTLLPLAVRSTMRGELLATGVLAPTAGGWFGRES